MRGRTHASSHATHLRAAPQLPAHELAVVPRMEVSGILIQSPADQHKAWVRRACSASAGTHIRPTRQPTCILPNSIQYIQKTPGPASACRWPQNPAYHLSGGPPPPRCSASFAWFGLVWDDIYSPSRRPTPPPPEAGPTQIPQPRSPNPDPCQLAAARQLHASCSPCDQLQLPLQRRQALSHNPLAVVPGGVGLGVLHEACLRRAGK